MEINIEYEITDSSDMTSDPNSTDSEYLPSISTSDFSDEEEEEEEELFVSLSQELRDNEEMFRKQQEEEENILKNESDANRKYGIDPSGKYYTNPDDIASYEFFCMLREKAKNEKKKT